MKVIFVTDRPQDWPFELAGSSVTNARTYLADAPRASVDARVINLCRSDRYQGRGYYVSLLAEARGHLPLPDVKTIEDLKSEEQLHAEAARLDPLVDETVHHDASDRFEIDSYFGRDPAGLHATLAQQLFEAVKAPLLRAHLARVERRWGLQKITAIGAGDVPSQHRAFLVEAAKAFITHSEPRASRSNAGQPKVAILWDPEEKHKPSNEQAVQKFIEAAPVVGLGRLPARLYAGAKPRRGPRAAARRRRPARGPGRRVHHRLHRGQGRRADEFMNVISPWEREHLLLHV